MIKQLITTCASVILSGGVAFAADLNGTFSGQGNGQAVTVTLQSRDGEVHGTVATGGGYLPLAGRESNGSIDGVWRAPNGQDISFSARINGTDMQLQTAGVTYSLSSHADANQVAQATAVHEPAAETQRQVQQAPAVQMPTNVEMCQSQVFTFPVPQGWQHNEGANAVFIYPADGSMSIGFTGLERVNTGTPIQFLQFMMEKVHDMPITQVIECKEVPYPGAKAIECIWITRRANGFVAKSWARCAITGFGGYILVVTAAADRFDGSVGMMKALADKIQISNADAGFDRQNALAVQANANYNHPMDHSFADQYWVNQKRIDGAMARGSDVRTGNYTSYSPSTGTTYDHGAGVFDNTGHVIDPENPNQYLVTRHWEGR